MAGSLAREKIVQLPEKINSDKLSRIPQFFKLAYHPKEGTIRDIYGIFSTS